MARFKDEPVFVPPGWPQAFNIRNKGMTPREWAKHYGLEETWVEVWIADTLETWEKQPDEFCLSLALQPPVRALHLTGREACMKAIAGISSKHMALLDEYRMALSLWSETRALYVSGAAEIIQATRHLEDLEYEIALGDVPLEPKRQSESGSAIGLLPPAA